jgi:hypothetical protein
MIGRLALRAGGVLAVLAMCVVVAAALAYAIERAS